MIGGLMNRTGILALSAGVVLLTAGGHMSARAADLGGDCCADLEERVAELEATTVRKGNRKVSLELSGQVDKALMAWNDGRQSDVYVVDNNYSSTRFRMKGTGEMTPGWKAGFYMEYEFRDASSNLVDQTTEQNRNLETALRIRQENLFVESATYGRVTLGQQNSATKDLTLINLGGGMNDPENYYASSFFIRDNTLSPTGGGIGPTAGALPFSTRIISPSPANGTVVGSTVGGLNWSNLSNALDGQRMELIRYDSPALFGFVASFAWGQNDVWDAALRYQKEWNSIRIAGGIGYQWWGERSLTLGAPFGATTVFPGSDQSNQPNPLSGPSAAVAGSQVFSTSTNTYGGITTQDNSKIEVIEGNISLLHIPTGLYTTWSAGTRHITNAPVAAFNRDATYFYTQDGITKRFFEAGATTFYGEYGNYNNFGADAIYFETFNPVGTVASATRVTSSDVNRWGAGFTQAFDGAALEFYTNYIHYSANITTRTTTNGTTTSGFGGYEARSPQDWDAVISGARLKF